MKKIIQTVAILIAIVICNSTNANTISSCSQIYKIINKKLVGPYPFTIVVIDELGKPVSGANVFIPESGLGSVNTDESGTATFMIDTEKGEMKALITTDGMTTTQMVSPDETNTVVISR